MTVKKRPRWYLNEVKDLQNRPWTEREKLAVFAWREELNTPVEVVARAYGVGKIQIYNITRLVRRSKSKECSSCGNQLTLKERRKQRGLIKSCDACKEHKKEYKRKRRERLLKKGICPYCEKRKVIPDKKSCKKCLSATHRRRYNVGVCGNCGKRPIADHSNALCYKCLKVNRKRATAVRKLKRMNNLTRKKKCTATGKSYKK